MPNGGDKNFDRLCATLDGFRFKYGSWPTLLRLRPDYTEMLRDMFTQEAWVELTQKVRFVEEDGALFIAEDDQGRRFDYGEDLPEDWWDRAEIHAFEWLGVMHRRGWFD